MNKKLTIQLLQILCLIIAVSCSALDKYSENKRILEKVTASDNCLYVLFDTGSSSTKVRMYQWPCKNYLTIPDLTLIAPIGNEDGFKLTTRINDVAKSEGAYKTYFQPAFDAIQRKLASLNSQNTKPFLFLRATAGLRLLPVDQQNQILNLVRGVFKKESSYHFLDDQWARVITGQQEGSFLWVSVNYALNNIQPGNKLPSNLSKFASVVDIGGASAQIAFACETGGNKFLQQTESNRFSLDSIHSTSLLGYGNDEARKNVVKQNNNGACFQRFAGDTEYSVDVGSNGTSDIRTFKGRFNEDECINQILSSVFGIKKCSYPLQRGQTDCSSVSGLQKITNQETIFGVSSIYYSKLSLGINGDKVNIKEFRDKAIAYCKGENSAKPSDGDSKKFNCFQMMLSTTLLIDGLGLGDKEVTAVDKHNNVAMDWSIGSLIQDINALQCEYFDQKVCGKLGK